MLTVDVARGRLAHYASCWDHLEQVCARLRRDTGHPAELAGQSPAEVVHRRPGVIDVP